VHTVALHRHGARAVAPSRECRLAALARWCVPSADDHVQADAVQAGVTRARESGPDGQGRLGIVIQPSPR
jgi:hypothetical protein